MQQAKVFPTFAVKFVAGVKVKSESTTLKYSLGAPSTPHESEPLDEHASAGENLFQSPRY